jgi:hypothetical protein
MKTYCHCRGRYDLIRHGWYGQQRHTSAMLRRCRRVSRICLTTESTGVSRAARVGLSNLPLCYPRPGLARISLGRFVVCERQTPPNFQMSDCREIFA